VEVSGLLLAAQVYATRRDVLAELCAAAGSPSRETKGEIIRAAYLTLLADKRIAEEERKKLKDMAAALRISENEFQAIIEAVAPSSSEEGIWLSALSTDISFAWARLRCSSLGRAVQAQGYGALMPEIDPGF